MTVLKTLLYAGRGQTTIRDKVAAHRLPLPPGPPGTARIGRGNGRTCDACDEAVTPDQLEYEVDLLATGLRFHRECLEAWHQVRVEGGQPLMP